MKKKLLKSLRVLLVAAGLCVGANAAWGTDWTTVWSADFSSEPTGFTYSISRGDIGISTGVLRYGVGSYNGCTTTAIFTDAKFAVETDWNLEFDWNGSSSNTDASSVTFATNEGNTFTITWAKNATTATVVDANSEILTETLPIAGYNKGSMTCDNHIVITGNADNGIYLTITSGETTYVNNVLVSSTYGYPTSFNGSLGRYVSHMAMDNIIFQTPKVVGYVSAPTGQVTGAVDKARKFTLSCLTENVTMYYSESDIEIGAEGWNTYSGEVTTSATTIYTYAKDASNNTSAKENFETGAGTVVSLNSASIAHTAANQYTISNDQTTVLGKPTATIHYQVDGATEQTSTDASVNVSITQNGTLTYWLTSEGYGATENTEVSVYVAIATKIEANTVNFCTSNSNAWSSHGDEVTVEGDDIHTFYKYKDQSGNIVSDGLLAVTFTNGTIDNSWRIQKSNGGVQAYNVEAYIALLGLKKNQIVQVNCNGVPTSTTNLSVIEGDTYTGTYSYRVVADGNVIFNIPKNSVIKTIGIYEDWLTPSISSYGYASFSSTYAIDMAEVPNATAWIATSGDSEKVTLEQVTGTIAAGTGLILKSNDGKAAEVNIPLAASGTTYNTESATKNYLFAVSSDYDLTASVSGTNYVLSVQGGKVVFAPIEGASAPVRAGQAALWLPSNAARALVLSFDDETTGITAVENRKNNDAAYNFNGQRVALPAKGLYIVGGKKVIVK